MITPNRRGRGRCWLTSASTVRLRPGLVALVVGGVVVVGACSDASAPEAGAPPASVVAGEPALPVATTTTSEPAPVVTEAAAPAPPAAAPILVGAVGPFPVASMVVPLVDDSRPTLSGGELVSSSRALTTLVWYPDVSLAVQWPLVVFAHGFEVGPGPYSALCEAWAAAGYVVAAPEFPLTDANVAGDYLDEYDVDNQPDDVRFVVGSLLAADSPLAGRVDPDRVAVAGHSDGGLTALSVATEPMPGLRGVIALSASPVDAGSMASPPILIVHGDADDVNPYDNGVALYDESAAPRFLLTLVGGDHLPPFLDGSPYLDAVDRVAVDFLDYYVAGRTATVGSLLGDDAPGLAALDADP